MMDNICAIATAYGVGAISIIRCSGPNAIELVNNIFKGKNLNNCKSHTIHYGYIMDKDEVIDEVLCNIYKAPNSFDGENCVEINCHGGVYVTNLVLQTLLSNGFRLAERGEFSKRAFLNKRLDLTEAESIMDIISANNRLALKSSTNSLRSKTKNMITSFRNEILDILAKIEVNIDYPEYEDAIDMTHNILKPMVENLINEMNEILENSKISTILISGIKTAIIGKPNVGKSSLLNMLLDEDKAIVSNIEGTTRDLVEGSLNIGNITLNLVDTAGIRQSSDYVEEIGIKRSKKAIEEADLILLVLDSSKKLEDLDYELLKLTENKKRIIIANKIDLNSCWSMDDAVLISTTQNKGIEALIKKIYEITNVLELDVDSDKYLNNNRQVNLMNKALVALNSAYESINNLVDISLIEIDIKEAFDNLGEITGEAYPEELMDALFTKFCLGK
jgi:tRNA modification GTPase